MSSKEDVDAERCPESGDGTHCDCWWDGAACCRCGSPADPDVCPDCGASDCLQHLATHKRLKREMADAMHDIDRMTDTTTELATDNEHLRAALDVVQSKLRTDASAWEHEEGHEDCRACEYEGLLSLVSTALAGSPAETEAEQWECTVCSRKNAAAETHCPQCEYSRHHTIAGVKHDRWCQANPCCCLPKETHDLK